MFQPNKGLLRNILLDLLAFFIFSASVVLYSQFVTPSHRGFFLDDQSLIYPYRDSTIAAWLLGVLCIIVPLSFISLLEILRTLKYAAGATRTFFNFNIPVYVWDIYVIFGIYMFGLSAQQIIVDVGKVTIGRLRPHFWEICQPVYNETSVQRLNYVEDYTCAGTDAHRLSEMRKSFPSGHTSIATFTSVFLALYVGFRVTWRGSDLLRPLVQFGLLIVGWFVGLTRVMDNKHHWSDIAVGYVIGFIAACITFFYVYRVPGFRNSKYNQRSETDELVWGPNNRPIAVHRPNNTVHINTAIQSSAIVDTEYGTEFRSTSEWDSPNLNGGASVRLS